MQYEPELAMKFGFSGDQDSAYRLCCVWINLFTKIFPDYVYGRIPQVKSLRKSTMWKVMMKLIREKNYKSIQEYEHYIKAQLSIMKKYSMSGPVLVEPTILVGEAADRRWFFWKKLVAKANKLTRQQYSMLESDMEFDLTVSLTEIEKILEENINFENFQNCFGKIKTSIILRKIKPIYVHISNWIKKLPDDLRNDLYKRCDAHSFEKYNLGRAEEVYGQLFPFEV